MPKESNINRSIRAMLNRRREKTGCKFVKTGITYAGEPDWLGSEYGQSFAIEVKQPGKALTRLQSHRLQEWAHAGAKVGRAESAQEFKAILDEAYKEMTGRNFDEANL